jgi:hypothetical protein
LRGSGDDLRVILKLDGLSVALCGPLLPGLGVDEVERSRVWPMRSKTLPILMLAALLGGCGSGVDVEADAAEAIARVEQVWGECLAAVGVTTADATAEPTGREVPAQPDAREMRVTLTNGAAFTVHIDGRMTGAAVANDEADAMLDQASELLGVGEGEC